VRLFVLTAATLTAFAANSLLCRMALGGDLIDPVTFTTVRLLSGAAVLVPLARFTREPAAAIEGTRGSWASAMALFAYAIAFSLAYISLPAGIGALILFGAVQATMIGFGLWSGERPQSVQWIGLSAALAGLVWLVWPGISAPDPVGAALMGVSGFAWGCYSLRGRGALTPIASTAGNFARTVPMAAAAAVAAILIGSVHAERSGVLLAMVSGALTSGLGYVLWYGVLRSLSTTQAAVLQLLVPVLAALGGVVFLAEVVSLRLVVASLSILGGVALAVRRS
jgi:drug/metabolite transporter (DMT)-like permease